MLIAGNWKMFKGPAETAAFCAAFEPPAGVEAVLCPPYVSLAAAVAGGATVFAQNVHWATDGAFTGEISVSMLQELGVHGAIVGHSERRQYFGETDETVARRAAAALEGGLRVIACVGELEEERERGETEAVLAPAALRARGAPRARDRLRARLGDRHRQDGDPRPRPRGPRLHQVAARRARPLRRLGQARQRRRADVAARSRRRARRRRLSRPRLVRRDMPVGRTYPLVALVILDGWGCAPPGPGNAVSLADTPVFDRLWASCPHTTIEASGEAVGLPPGQMGNSEVGHLTIGSGRVLDQDLMRVNRAIASGALFENEALVSAFRRGAQCPPDRSRLARRRPLPHRPPEGAARARPPRGQDGADLDPRVHRRSRRLADLGRARPRRASGRPDRDRGGPVLRDGPRQALGAHRPRARRDHAGTDPEADDPVAAVQASYDAGITDEFIVPIAVRGRPRLQPGDAAIFFNFRPDRGRQLTERLLGRRLRRDHDDALSRGPRLPGRLPRAGGGAGARRGARRARRPPAPRRRDREVRARDLLLQRRRGAGVAGGDADPRPVAARCAELRPQARDVRPRGGRAAARPRSATGTASRSSTSRTPTWSGTPA